MYSFCPQRWSRMRHGLPYRRVSIEIIVQFLSPGPVYAAVLNRLFSWDATSTQVLHLTFHRPFVVIACRSGAGTGVAPFIA